MHHELAGTSAGDPAREGRVHERPDNQKNGTMRAACLLLFIFAMVLK